MTKDNTNKNTNEPTSTHHSESYHHVETYATGQAGMLKMAAETKDKTVKMITDQLAKNYAGGLVVLCYEVEDEKNHGVQTLVTGAGGVVALADVAKELTEVVGQLAEQGIGLLTKEAQAQKGNSQGSPKGDDLLNAIRNAIKNNPEE
jgi:hypothetical protein